MLLRAYTSVYRAYACTSFAVDARAFVNYVYIAFGDAGNGAFINASPTCDASIGNFVRHIGHLLNFFRVYSKGCGYAR
jgi:hypothetical protein